MTAARSVLERARGWERQNLAAARLILRTIEYGRGPQSLAVRWALAVIARIQGGRA